MSVGHSNVDVTVSHIAGTMLRKHSSTVTYRRTHRDIDTHNNTTKRITKAQISPSSLPVGIGAGRLQNFSSAKSLIDRKSFPP
jgi:hypothetical protein